jgi:DNA-binding XRE family transcriptional regulator
MLSKIIPNRKKIIETRIRQGLTVADVAKKCNVSRQAIYQIERGTNRANPKVAKLIAETLDMEYDELFKIEIDG